MHISIPIANTMEFIEATEISPLITKCKVKVCYVGQDPNRNGTVITKEVATDMGKKLPGSPIVGCFNKETQDFDTHTKQITISGGKIEMVELTRPYGFVPTDAKVGFQKYSDDGIEHEYLVTECYLWTSAYPECQGVVEHGNNQSMELDKDRQAGFWSNDYNSGKRIFIYNEALIEKLCILGQDIEPCFEGAQITSFSLNTDEFMRNMYSMIAELQETLNKGGSQEPMNNNENMTEFEKQQEEEKKKNTPPAGETEEKKEEKGKEEEKKKNYNLDEIPEYQELLGKYSELQGQFSTLQQAKATLESEVIDLRQFKLTAERKSKQDMIDSFYMLSDADKKDVVDHMDTYSIDDIEAKLSIICVRNKVDFSNNQPDAQKQDNKPQGLFNLESAATQDANVPAWLKVVRETAKN